MKLRSVLKKLAISLCTVVLLLCSAEVAARLAEPGPFSFFDRSPYTEVGRGHIHTPNFSGRWDGTWYGIESHGLRGPEWKPSMAATEYRVLAVGDSCTFGKGVDEPDCWPRQFEGLLGSNLPPGHRALVANGGVNGYSARQYAQVIRELARVVRPNLIVVGYNLNDFPNQTKAVDETVHQSKGNLRSKIPFDLRKKLSRLALFRWLRATYYTMNRERDFAAAERMSSEVKRQGELDAERTAKELGHLDTMVTEAKEQGAHLCVLLFPYESQVYLEKYDTAAIDWLREQCEARGIPFISMVGDFRTRAYSKNPPKKLFLRGDRYHPDPEGYGIVAQRVLDVVRDQGWLPTGQ
ncbi:MAG: SGNH/GDSL hydrolase family protein [Planctomycetes bacterium]|nr:SGNH/GDSL hydrolase family protein [Planctomycetota bacterium]